MPSFAGLGHAIKDISRFSEILTVLTRHGFGFLIDQLHLEKYRPAKARICRLSDTKVSVPARVRQMMEELGPTFIKLGQVLSMRPDIIPEEYLVEFSRLQDQVPAFTQPSPALVVQNELGKSIKQAFKAFALIPMAAASIAQVHEATTFDKKHVVVKLQRPGLKRIVESDLEILRFFAMTWERFSGFELPRRPVEFIDEFEKLIREELDFTKEARHLERFAKNFEHRPGFRFPRVEWELTTAHCLTLEYIEGTKLSRLPKKLSREKKDELAQQLFTAYVHMVLEDRFFHADPHPGNFILTQNGELAFLDAGQVGRLDMETVTCFTEMLMALINKDIDTLVDAYLRLGTVEAGVDERMLKRDVSLFLEQYYDLPVEKISFGIALQNLLGLAVKYRIQLPPDFVILGKTFMGVEGMARQLNPELNLIQVVQPAAAEIMRKRYTPQQLASTLFRQLHELQRFLLHLPQQLQDLLGKLQRGNLKIEFQHQGLEELEHKLDHASNRVSFALIVAALIVSSAWILASQSGPRWGGVSILGLIGFLLAGLFGLWLLISILRSGRM